VINIFAWGKLSFVDSWRSGIANNAGHHRWKKRLHKNRTTRRIPFIKLRAAFTLVELLIVIGIIGVLTAMLLPAVNTAREAGRRTTCKNNIRQLTLAIKIYEEQRKRFPQSGRVGQPGQAFPRIDYDGRTGVMQSWIVTLLPFIEEQGIAKQIDPNTSILNQAGDPQAKWIQTLLCPSDGAAQVAFKSSTFTNNKEFGKGNYAAYVSPVHIEFQVIHQGALISLPKHSARDIIDGVSKTIVLAEVRRRANELDPRGAWALPWCGTTQLALDLHDTESYNWESGKDYSRSLKKYVADLIYIGQTARPNGQGPNTDVLYSCPDAAGAQLDKMPCRTWTTTGSNSYFSAAPRSQHINGVFATLLDGSVFFLSDLVDERVLAYLVATYDAAIIKPEDYTR
jgi:prepilin-type N-terminal cleavage/methylation domain-containing protein